MDINILFFIASGTTNKHTSYSFVSNLDNLQHCLHSSYKKIILEKSMQDLDYAVQIESKSKHKTGKYENKIYGIYFG